MSDTCPTCGASVRVVTSDEGTSYYVPDEGSEDTVRVGRGDLEAVLTEYMPDYDFQIRPVDRLRTALTQGTSTRPPAKVKAHLPSPFILRVVEQTRDQAIERAEAAEREADQIHNFYKSRIDRLFHAAADAEAENTKLRGAIARHRASHRRSTPESSRAADKRLWSVLDPTPGEGE